MSVGEILLVPKILICGNQKLVVILLRSLKQRAVVQVGPSSLKDRIDRVPSEMPPEGHRSALIE